MTKRGVCTGEVCIACEDVQCRTYIRDAAGDECAQGQEVSLWLLNRRELWYMTLMG